MMHIHIILQADFYSEAQRQSSGDLYFIASKGRIHTKYVMAISTRV